MLQTWQSIAGIDPPPIKMDAVQDVRQHQRRQNLEKEISLGVLHIAHAGHPPQALAHFPGSAASSPEFSRKAHASISAFAQAALSPGQSRNKPSVAKFARGMRAVPVVSGSHLPS